MRATLEARERDFAMPHSYAWDIAEVTQFAYDTTSAVSAPRSVIFAIGKSGCAPLYREGNSPLSATLTRPGRLSASSM